MKSDVYVCRSHKVTRAGQQEQHDPPTSRRSSDLFFTFRRHSFFLATIGCHFHDYWSYTTASGHPATVYDPNTFGSVKNEVASKEDPEKDHISALIITELVQKRAHISKLRPLDRFSFEVKSTLTLVGSCETSHMGNLDGHYESTPPNAGIN